VKKRLALGLLITVLSLSTLSCWEEDKDPCPTQICCMTCDDWCSEGGSTFQCMDEKDCKGPDKMIKTKADCKH
jgi:hypothetical protein